MWRFGYDTSSSFLLVLALLAMLAAVIVWQKHRTSRTITIWFWAGIFGILLGCAGTFATSRITEGRLLASSGGGAPVGGDEADPGATESGGGTPEVAGGPGGPGGGMGRGGGGMFGGPRPKRDLTSLVRKVALLTGDVGIGLSGEQSKALLAAIADIESPETMSDDEAQAKHDELLALLDEQQKEQLDAIGLPRGPRPRGGPGGERPAEDANPFAQETNLEAVNMLRERFAGATDDAAK